MAECRAHAGFVHPDVQVGRAASHRMDNTATDVLTEYMGWKSGIGAYSYIGMTASPAAAWVQCFHKRRS